MEKLVAYYKEHYPEKVFFLFHVITFRNWSYYPLWMEKLYMIELDS